MDRSMDGRMDRWIYQEDISFNGKRGFAHILKIKKGKSSKIAYTFLPFHFQKHHTVIREPYKQFKKDAGCLCSWLHSTGSVLHVGLISLIKQEAQINCISLTQIIRYIRNKIRTDKEKCSKFAENSLKLISSILHMHNISGLIYSAC